MERFRGDSEHTIDSKGRIIVPSRFRQVLDAMKSKVLVISRLDGGLVAYPYEKWTQIEDKILALAEKSDRMRRFRRFFIGAATECPIGSQDRVLIPPKLRSYAGFEKDIVLVGVLDHFEIWDSDRLESENMLLEKEDRENEEVRNEVAKIGL